MTFFQTTGLRIPNTLYSSISKRYVAAALFNVNLMQETSLAETIYIEFKSANCCSFKNKKKINHLWKYSHDENRLFSFNRKNLKTYS